MPVTATAADLVARVEEASEWLARLDETTVRHKPTPERWSIAEVIGHLVDSATNNHQRFIRAQEADELVFPKYDQNSWAEKSGYHDADWRELVELWRLYNRLLAGVIRRIPAEKLTVRCTIGPYDPCTLEFLVVDYLDHLEHHLKKIRERLADASEPTV